MSLLSEIEAATVDSKTSLADVLRKCKVLAARLKHQELALWVGHELNGYPFETELPTYRSLNIDYSVGHFSGPFGSGLKNAPIPTSGLPDEIREMVTRQELRQSIGEIHELAANARTLHWKWTPDLISHVAHHHQIYTGGVVLMDAWVPIPAAVLKGVLDTVRTRILDFVLAIQTENPDAGDVALNAPPPIPIQTLNQHFNMTIIGGQANLGNVGPSSIGGGNIASIGNSQTGYLQDSTVQQLLAELKLHATTVNSENQAEALDALNKVESHLSKGKPDIERVKSYLGLFGTIVTVAMPTIEKLVQYLGPMLM